MTKIKKKPKYTSKEKRVYHAKKKEEKVEKGKAAPRQKIMHRVWADAHTGIDQKIGDERKAKGQCTRCTLTKHGWKHFQKGIRVSTIQRKPLKLPGGRSNHPKPRKPRVATVAEDSRGETAHQPNQRPLAWVVWRMKSDKLIGTSGDGMWVVRPSNRESKQSEVNPSAHTL